MQTPTPLRSCTGAAVVEAESSTVGKLTRDLSRPLDGVGEVTLMQALSGG